MIKITEWGTDDRRDAHLIRIERGGLAVQLTDIGAAVVSITMRDKNGELKDVVWGYDRAEDYFENPLYFGATIGRNANRIANARFMIEGQVCNLDKNEGENNLHSGANGYHKRRWTVISVNEERSEVCFSLQSPDGDQGFPGNADICVVYSLTENGGLHIKYRAQSDKTTLFNLTNHSYFNLDGQDSDCAEEHILQIHADSYVPVNEEGIPTGEICSVLGTPMDFLTPTAVGKCIDSDFPQLKLTNGYDHNWVLIKGDRAYSLAAMLYSEKSGIRMSVYTNMPGMQFYSGNSIGGVTGKNGRQYGSRSALCFETQFFPDAPNHKHFPSGIFKDNEVFSFETEYRFSVVD
ncbi:MAG: galactose mutarotase [Oscillospiraceae bacterium]|nr:galactose mutarotase [Oscillospiraceae bacterium]